MKIDCRCGEGQDQQTARTQRQHDSLSSVQPCTVASPKIGPRLEVPLRPSASASNPPSVSIRGSCFSLSASVAAGWEWWENHGRVSLRSLRLARRRIERLTVTSHDWFSFFFPISLYVKLLYAIEIYKYYKMSLLDQQAQACYFNLSCSSALVTSVHCRVQKSFSNFYRQFK